MDSINFTWGGGKPEGSQWNSPSNRKQQNQICDVRLTTKNGNKINCVCIYMCLFFLETFCNLYDEFECGIGQCIPHYYQCDGDQDCIDHSDEIGCPCK